MSIKKVYRLKMAHHGYVKRAWNFYGTETEARKTLNEAVKKANEELTPEDRKKHPAYQWHAGYAENSEEEAMDCADDFKIPADYPPAYRFGKNLEKLRTYLDIPFYYAQEEIDGKVWHKLIDKGSLEEIMNTENFLLIKQYLWAHEDFGRRVGFAIADGL